MGFRALAARTDAAAPGTPGAAHGGSPSVDRRDVGRDPEPREGTLALPEDPHLEAFLPWVALGTTLGEEVSGKGELEVRLIVTDSDLPGLSDEAKRTAPEAQGPTHSTWFGVLVFEPAS